MILTPLTSDDPPCKRLTYPASIRSAAGVQRLQDRAFIRRTLSMARGAKMSDDCARAMQEAIPGLRAVIARYPAYSREHERALRALTAIDARAETRVPASQTGLSVAIQVNFGAQNGQSGPELPAVEARAPIVDV